VTETGSDYVRKLVIVWALDSRAIHLDGVSVCRPRTSHGTFGGHGGSDRDRGHPLDRVSLLVVRDMAIDFGSGGI
jgi:hypothetical protein